MLQFVAQRETCGSRDLQTSVAFREPGNSFALHSRLPAAASPAISPSTSDSSKSADSRRLTGAVNIRHRRLLKLIYAHATAINLASQQLRKLDIRHEMKTARKIITRNLPTLPTAIPTSRLSSFSRPCAPPPNIRSDTAHPFNCRFKANACESLLL
jgi:hypothetical protein